MDEKLAVKEDVAISTEGNVSASQPSMTALKEDVSISAEGNVPDAQSSMHALKEDVSITTPEGNVPASQSYWNKAGCAVTGGLITAVGLVMIPAPTPCGCIVTAYGLSVLGREFEGAQKVVEGTKENLERGLDAWAKDWGKEDEEDDVKETDITRQTTPDYEEISQNDDNNDSKEEEGSCNEEIEGASTVEQVAYMNEAHKALLEQQMEQKPEKQSPLDTWGKAWNSHTRNFRKGTSTFISGKLLPALRDLDLTHKKKKTTTAESIAEDTVVVQLEDNEKVELNKALGELDLNHKKENVTTTDSIEEDAVIVQIGDNENEKIMLSKEEIEMIKGTIDNHEASSEAADASLVPDYTESVVSDSSQSNGGDVDEASWVRTS